MLIASYATISLVLTLDKPNYRLLNALKCEMGSDECRLSDTSKEPGVSIFYRGSRA